MKTLELSTCFITERVDACREFYQRHFLAEALFDCGWYLNLRFPHSTLSLQFMHPQEGMPSFSGEGIMLNFKVDDVDAEHARLTQEGLEISMPLEDHPWGDRGFSIIDPIGISLYLYSEREPHEEFKPYFKA